jgi:RNA polymerase sigma factor (sigma-70 family)
MSEYAEEAVTRSGDETLAVRNDVLAALKTLPEEQRSAVILTLCYGYSSNEVAEMLHTTSDAVRQRVCRGLRRIRALL